jgi:DNA primase
VYSSETVSRVLAAVDIVQVVGSYLPLKPAGRNHKALCPFHTEKTPSFIVNGERQIFHCFGCGEGGDAIGFLMKHERLSFPEALRALAERAGIALPPRPGGLAGAARGDEGRLQALQIHQAAAEFFRERLADGTEGRVGRAYLSERGVPDAIVEQFGIGCAPAAWDGLLRHLLRRGFSKEQVEWAGLALSRKEGGGAYDRFRNRLMIPICDAAGKVIAFGGRALDGSDPKYLNSPETAIYRKGAHLFGLHLAVPAIRERGLAIVVEGYFDVIALHAHGFRHSVAVLGTALTADQIALLRRHTTRAVLAFDPDPAGIAAARRSVESLLNSGIEWRVLMLPAGQDPDRALREGGAAAIAAALDDARDLMDFLLDRRVSGFDLTSAEGQAAAITATLPLLAGVESEITRHQCADRLARRVALPAAAIFRELAVLTRGRRRAAVPPALRPRALPSPEWTLMHLALHHPGAARKVRETVRAEELEDGALRRIFQWAVLGMGSGSDQGPLALEEPEVQRVLSRLLATPLEEYDDEAAIEQAVLDCLARIQARFERREREQLRRQMEQAEQAGDHAAVARLQARVLALTRDRDRRDSGAAWWTAE